MTWMMSRSFRSDKTIFIQINRIEFLYSSIKFPKVLKNANFLVTVSSLSNPEANGKENTSVFANCHPNF